MAEIAKKSQGLALRKAGDLLRRFHLLLFFILIVGCLAVAVILINKTLTDSSDDTYISTINAGSIDQSTLNRVQSLHPSSQPAEPLQQPEGRINPFAE